MDALIAGFPAGTVSGAPKVRAMEIIEELEPERRGIYGGCVGYFGAGGSMDTCIALRTAEVADEIGRAHVCTPVTNAQNVCSLMLDKKKENIKNTIRSNN